MNLIESNFNEAMPQTDEIVKSKSKAVSRGGAEDAEEDKNLKPTFRFSLRLSASARKLPLSFVFEI